MTDLRALIEALLNAAPPGAKYIELDDVRALLADVPPAPKEVMPNAAVSYVRPEMPSSRHDVGEAAEGVPPTPPAPAATEPRCAFVTNPRDGVICGFPRDNHPKHHDFVAPAVDEAMRVDTVVQYAAEESVVPLKQQLRWAVHNGASWADSSLHAESADALDERDATIARLEAAIKHVCEECPGVPCSKHRTPQYVLEMAAALQRVEALCVDDPTGEFACMVDKREIRDAIAGTDAATKDSE